MHASVGQDRGKVWLSSCDGYIALFLLHIVGKGFCVLISMNQTDWVVLFGLVLFGLKMLQYILRCLILIF